MEGKDTKEFNDWLQQGAKLASKMTAQLEHTMKNVDPEQMKKVTEMMDMSGLNENLEKLKTAAADLNNKMKDKF